MKIEPKKIVGWLHLWLGLLSGIVVFIVCITGCLWVFNREVTDIMSPGYEVTQRDTAYISPSQMMKRLREQLPVRDDVYARWSTVERKRALADSAYPFLFFGPHELHVYIDDREIWMDPYNGDLLAVWQWGGPYRDFFDFILEGHRELWLPHPYGHYVVQYATLIFMILLITGLVLWWPKNKAARRQRLWFKWKESTQWRRKNYDLHNIPGFWTLILTFLLGFTGLGIGLVWFAEGVEWILSGGKEHTHEWVEETPVYSDSTLIGTGKIPYTDFDRAGDSVVAIIRDRRPGENRYGFLWPDLREGKTVFHVFGAVEKGYHALKIDKYSLEVLSSVMPPPKEEKDLAHTVEALYRPIHYGSIWGLPTKILAFIGSLVGASLPVTGAYIWWGRRKKGKGESKSRPDRARATVGKVVVVRKSRIPLRTKGDSDRS